MDWHNGVCGEWKILKDPEVRILSWMLEANGQTVLTKTGRVRRFKSYENAKKWAEKYELQTKNAEKG